jgi:sulfur relay (sulfurtransferase) DsrC/TusE family protein
MEHITIRRKTIGDEIAMTEELPDNIKEVTTEATPFEQYKKWVYTVLAKQPHGQIELSELEKKVLNLFTFYDNRFNMHPHKKTIFKNYFQKFGSKTEEQKMAVISAAKEDITRKMIYHRSIKSPKFKKVYLRKTLCTPCGWLRLGVTLAHNKKALTPSTNYHSANFCNTSFELTSRDTTISSKSPKVRILGTTFFRERLKKLFQTLGL